MVVEVDRNAVVVTRGDRDARVSATAFINWSLSNNLSQLTAALSRFEDQNQGRYHVLQQYYADTITEYK